MGVVTGITFFLGALFQTYGIQGTTAGKAGFITGLSTVMVPFMVRFKDQQHLQKKTWIAVALSVIGMAFLMLEGESGILLADLLILICAIFFAVYIVLNGFIVNSVDLFLYSLVQLMIITLLSFISSLLLKESWDLISLDLSFWGMMVYLGLIMGTFSLTLQNWCQRHINPAHTAIIFTLEPVFGLLFGMWIGSETISILGGIGSAVIFSAIFISSLKNEDAIPELEVSNTPFNELN